jgi:protease-4
LRALFVVLLFDLLGCNFLFLLAAFLPSLGGFFGDGDSHIVEHLYSGKSLSSNKIAIVHIDGVLIESLTGFVQKEIDRAARDNSVKAVVVQINSPGGSITASDDLHRRISELRAGDAEKKTRAKTVIVSMASVAASGGYYIAMPAQTVLAERTTITGSIGVYAALPNVSELGNKIGFRMETIRAGEVKDSGSPFRDMTPKERQLWQDMVDHAYLGFIHVVEQGRPSLKGKLQEDIAIDKTVPVRDEKVMQKQFKLKRYRADGGIFTADDALKYGLIDQIGYLDDAIKVAKQAAGLADDYKVVSYERPVSFLGSLLGSRAEPPQMNLLPGRLAAGALPRLWYLSPQSELSAWLSTVGRE